MRTSGDYLDLPDGTRVSWRGPTSAEVARPLVRAGFAKQPRAALVAGEPGFAAVRPRGVAYVEVLLGRTDDAERFRAALQDAGFVVQGHTTRDDVLVVFEPFGRR